MRILEKFLELRVFFKILCALEIADRSDVDYEIKIMLYER